MQKSLLLLIVTSLSACTWTKNFGTTPAPSKPDFPSDDETRFVCVNGLEIFTRAEASGLRIRFLEHDEIQSALLNPETDGSFFNKRGAFNASTRFTPNRSHASFHYTDPYGKSMLLDCTRS